MKAIWMYHCADGSTCAFVVEAEDSDHNTLMVKITKVLTMGRETKDPTSQTFIARKEDLYFPKK